MESSIKPDVHGWLEKRKLAKLDLVLEEKRTSVLLNIAQQKSNIEQMAQRPRSTDDAIDSVLLEDVKQALTTLADNAQHAEHIAILSNLDNEADEQGNFSAYLCPRWEIGIEGHLAFELMEWWGVPKSETTRLRALLERKIEGADNEPEDGRRALFALFNERDEWSEYRDDYEDIMRIRARWLLIAIMTLPILAVATFYFALLHAPVLYAPLLALGIIFAGWAGSCVSVISKLPTLEVCLSEKLDSYDRLIWSRLSVGTIASVIGCAFLGWGLIPISIQGQSFAAFLDVNSKSVSSIGDAFRMLVLLAVPLLLGFSERIKLFERLVFGKAKNPEKQKPTRAV
jgi:hypothetical protein